MRNLRYNNNCQHHAKLKHFKEHSTLVKDGKQAEVDINVSEDKIWSNKLKFRDRRLNLSVDYSRGVTKMHDIDENGRWEYEKTFKRIEKYSDMISNSVLNKNTIKQYITDKLTYDNYDINFFNGSERPQTTTQEQIFKETEIRNRVQFLKTKHLFGINQDELPEKLREQLLTMTDKEKLKFLNAYFDIVERELSSQDIGSQKMQN